MAAELSTDLSVARKWTTTKESLFQGKIPFNDNYFKVLNIDLECNCDSNCECHWDAGQANCACMWTNVECDASCAGCDEVLSKGLSDNRQISRLGVTPKKTDAKYLNQQMGYSMVLQEDFKAGDCLVGFTGNVILEKNLPQGHNIYVVSMGKLKLKLKKAHGNYEKGKIFEGEFVMDCTDFGTDANLINSTCNNNNAEAYTMIVKGVPIPAIFAKKDGKKGLF